MPNLDALAERHPDGDVTGVPKRPREGPAVGRDEDASDRHDVPQAGA